MDQEVGFRKKLKSKARHWFLDYLALTIPDKMVFIV
ncbi:hypothetical protein SAMN04488082_11326 [Desulfomicrobium apsheronum]|uniref:Uncharacterized protein n=1 Tax=Desulfomicrobium apsheronum TaxID=52560 RepID=A0A1I3WG24_9BACT|nr:hypothetical protein SAMN04488082_11326 [Desulfomicrobium apsheronum]